MIMTKLEFKTNLKCQGCVDKIAQSLDNEAKIQNWKVDLSSPEKVLSVETTLPAQHVRQLIEQNGYKAELK